MVLSVAACAACVLCGYVVRYLHERQLRSRRERVLRALGGQLPDWERNARNLEDQVQVEAMHGHWDNARRLRREADITRRRGQLRDRMWT
jgi:hypothetical protein